MKLPESPHGGAYRAFPDAPEAYRTDAWDATLKALFEVAIAHTEHRIAWYDQKAVGYANSARLIRRGSLILFALGTLAPVVATLLGQLITYLKDGTDHVAQPPLAEAGYVLLALAGGLVIFDQFFGYSSSWVRFRQSQARLDVMLADLRFSWAALMAKRSADAEALHRIECTALLHDFVVAVERLAEEETREWAANFRSRIDTFDRNADLRLKTIETPRLVRPPVPDKISHRRSSEPTEEKSGGRQTITGSHPHVAS